MRAGSLGKHVGMGFGGAMPSYADIRILILGLCQYACKPKEGH